MFQHFWRRRRQCMYTRLNVNDTSVYFGIVIKILIDDFLRMKHRNAFAPQWGSDGNCAYDKAVDKWPRIIRYVQYMQMHRHLCAGCCWRAGWMIKCSGSFSRTRNGREIERNREKETNSFTRVCLERDDVDSSLPREEKQKIKADKSRARERYYKW